MEWEEDFGIKGVMPSIDKSKKESREIQEERKTGNVIVGKKNTSKIGKMCCLTDREDNWKLIERNNFGKPKETTLEKKNRANDQDDGKCRISDIWKWKMIEEKFWKHESCRWK